MPEIILHHYLGSPYAEKIRSILGYKGLAWASVEISEVMPRPRLMPLTGGYRRSPVLQVGADVYCDTRRIALFLEEHTPEPTLFPRGSCALSELFSNWAEPRVFLSSGPVRLQTPEDVAGVFRGRVAVEDFIADRTLFMAPALDVIQAPALVAAAKDQVRSFFGTLASLLSDGRSFLAAGQPSLADFSAYHTAWWLLQPPRVTWVFDEFSEIEPWAERIARFGHGRKTDLSAEEAFELARLNEPGQREVVDALDPAGRKPGDWIRVSADDYGQDVVEGRLVALGPDVISILREDPEVGTIINHFPRIGFRVLGAEHPAATA